MDVCQTNWIILLDFMLLFCNVQASYECTAGTWGAQCGKKCGQCVGGGEFCQVFDGRCMNGCASGFKGKLCKDKCPRGTFGPYCMETCGHCDQGSKGCDTITGHCENGCRPGWQLPFCKTHSKNRECINQYALDELIKKYAPPNVLEIPWQSMVSVIGVLALFVVGNFIWWWCMVRKPLPPKENLMVERDEKPDYLVETQEERNVSMVLSRLKRKMATEAAAAEAAKKARKRFPFSFPKFYKKKEQEEEKTLQFATNLDPDLSP
ncbi:scavenger receptor class F member 2 [Elysia marginata]|uniref:Scavenger receptor class F member 2 n=1 Tax=Elysia marginata TaxID=1093978 RepID=A0AAV4JWJ3_9GAST|nr:scavenger receptor class F member 2 [Elysia marginata]